MKITTSAFQPSKPIPDRYTFEKGNISPDIAWQDAPAGTKSFALIMDDPDAPNGTWTHWVAYNIPATKTSIAEGETGKNSFLEGGNDYGKPGYGGPCPPKGHGPHRYFFKLYALNTMLSLKAGASKQELEAAIKGHVLAQAEVVGTYEVK